MAFFIATGVLVLCRDDVAKEVSLSRKRFPCRDRDNQGKRLGVSTWLGFGQEISCRDRVFYVATELGQD